jgi:hypothetical protein
MNEHLHGLATDHAEKELSSGERFAVIAPTSRSALIIKILAPCALLSVNVER